MRMQANDQPMSFSEALTGVRPETSSEAAQRLEAASLRAYRDLARRVWAYCLFLTFTLACFHFASWAITGTPRYAAAGWGFLGLALFTVVLGVALRGVPARAMPTITYHTAPTPGPGDTR